MGTFRKKPVLITAEQWFPGKEVAGVKVPVPGDGEPYVVTIHGAPCPVQPGDWIVPEPDGIHYYPIKPDIFKNNYEAVKPEPKSALAVAKKLGKIGK